MSKGNPTKPKKMADSYSVTEVGTLLEALDKKFDTLAEGQSGLDTRMERLEVTVHGNSRRLDTIELRINVLNGKASRLEDAVSKLSKDLRDTRTELGETRSELKEEIRGIGNRLTAAESGA